MTRYLLYSRLGGPRGRSGRVRKTFPHGDWIPGPSSPYRVAIPTTLDRPTGTEYLNKTRCLRRNFMCCPGLWHGAIKYHSTSFHRLENPKILSIHVSQWKRTKNWNILKKVPHTRPMDMPRTYTKNKRGPEFWKGTWHTIRFLMAWNEDALRRLNYNSLHFSCPENLTTLCRYEIDRPSERTCGYGNRNSQFWRTDGQKSKLTEIWWQQGILWSK